MENPGTHGLIQDAIRRVEEGDPYPSKPRGKWLEELTVEMAPYIKEWDIAVCWLWRDWPHRTYHLPQSSRRDLGIDAVAVRRSDGAHIAIQCKSRQLTDGGKVAPLDWEEISTFVGKSSGDLWAERWLVANGDVPLAPNAVESIPPEKPVKEVNIAADLRQQLPAFIDEECPHCQPNPNGEWRRRTLSCMQDEAVAESVRILREHEQSDSGGRPVGQARGKLILPCGTGKTRVSLRIVEELTAPGELSIVLCPSIALVAQIRREYLQNARNDIRPLAVCSDQTAGYDPAKESARSVADDPTIDNSNVSASVVKGMVTTDPQEIARWIRDGQSDPTRISVLFGTYQSGRPIADALADAGVTARVLIADEAHRTAGLRRKKNARSNVLSPDEQRIRDFALCHDNGAFPATYRVYQTATPRFYNEASKRKVEQNDGWIVRSMDDETVFGVELYSRTYGEAVRNGWLADYRIIAVGVNGDDAFDVANRLARDTESKGRNRLTTTHFLRGLAFALAMGGATQGEESGNVPIKSCIAFMNTVDKSKNMARELQQPFVRDWLQQWLADSAGGRTAALYSLEHLDATSNVALRENAKRRLGVATEATPHGVVNVGVFGEGVDSPSLSAVAFLEPRKSPIDVVQAVGRAMRVAPDKSMGYIICPIVFPANADPERWLSNSSPEEGWQELGQILLALRAHDSRIGEELSKLLHLYIPKIPETVHTFIGTAIPGTRRIQYWVHAGAPGDAMDAVKKSLTGVPPRQVGFRRVPAQEEFDKAVRESPSAPRLLKESGPVYDVAYDAPTTILTGKVHPDGSIEMRTDSVARGKPDSDGNPGPFNVEDTKKKTGEVLNGTKGKPALSEEELREKQAQQERKAKERQMRLLEEMEEFGNSIRINLLEKSGLANNRIVRDLNILESSIREATHHLRADKLQPALDRHFGLDNLKESDLNKQADGCTVASLLIMNAAMLHQRIANGGWLPGISDLAAVKNDVNVVRRINREWGQILSHDFRPVIEPALKAIQTVEDTGKLAGLERALRHIAAEAERIAETYADMGADHAGPLFNRVMGNQASDGAFFTRPVAASIAARLTLDACGEQDWTKEAVWRDHKTVDLACGSGTLLAAMLADMKRRAREQGADPAQIANLQRAAVEDTLKGLDINPVSLQLAAAQLTAGNHDIRYKRMGLHLMPYGPDSNNPAHVSVGTLELLGQSAIVPRPGTFDLGDDEIRSEAIGTERDDVLLEDAVEAVKNPRIVIMNPPFTERVRMGQKFPKDTQESLRQRTDKLEEMLVKADSELENFVSRRAVRPLFVTLAERCLDRSSGVLTMITPTIMFSATSGLQERRTLARRFHVHTVLTCHQPRNFNMSQNTNINESIVVMRRHDSGTKPPTRFINLDKMPVGENDVAALHRE